MIPTPGDFRKQYSDHINMLELALRANGYDISKDLLQTIIKLSDKIKENENIRLNEIML